MDLQHLRIPSARLKMSPPKGPSKQQGALLVTSLVFLVIMTLIGVTAMRTAVLDEKMASNFRCSKIAFEAAEASILNAERDMIANLVVPLDSFDGNLGTSGHEGRYWLTQNEPSVNSLFTVGTWTSGNASASYSSNIAGIATQPRWLTKVLAIDGPLNLSMEGETGVVFRTTARGTGCTDESVVMVRTIYRKFF